MQEQVLPTTASALGLHDISIRAGQGLAAGWAAQQPRAAYQWTLQKK